MKNDFEDKRSTRKKQVPKKKTDRLQWERKNQEIQTQRSAQEGAQEGRVLDIIADSIYIQPLSKSDSIYRCTLRGVLKREQSHEKNLIVVGDLVFFSISTSGEGVVEMVQKRRSLLSRVDSSGKKEKLIAANIDIALITASLHSPKLRLALIDRTIIAARKGNLQPVIVINKIDLLHKESDFYLLDELHKLYPTLGVPVIAVSAKSDLNLDQLRDYIEKKAVVFVGPSGTGKSTLINKLAATDLRTQEISHKTLKGVHTTTRAALIALPKGGWCIDTPGIETLGFFTLDPRDLKNYFPEFEQLSYACHFPDCTHIHEPNCAIQRALHQGEIHPMRFQSYLALFRDLS